MPTRLPETFARLPVVAGYTSAMTPRMTLGTSVSGAACVDKSLFRRPFCLNSKGVPEDRTRHVSRIQTGATARAGSVHSAHALFRCAGALPLRRPVRPARSRTLRATVIRSMGSVNGVNILGPAVCS